MPPALRGRCVPGKSDEQQGGHRGGRQQGRAQPFGQHVPSTRQRAECHVSDRKKTVARAVPYPRSAPPATREDARCQEGPDDLLNEEGESKREGITHRTAPEWSPQPIAWNATDVSIDGAPTVVFRTNARRCNTDVAWPAGPVGGICLRTSRFDH